MTEGEFFQEEPPAYGSGGGRPAPLQEYLGKLERALKRGDATEHTHRPALKELLEALDPHIVATNEPKRSDCGAPDYVISRRRDQLSLGYVEAKDIVTHLDEAQQSDQLRRYLASLPNLLLTDYLEFRWFVDGARRETFRLAYLGTGGKLTPVSAPELERARSLLLSFLSHRPVDIASAEGLARRLASLAHVVRDIIARAFQAGQASQQLRDWRDAFAHTLLPELAPQPDANKETEAVGEFADMFAQTLAYGLFSARVEGGGAKFTREKAQKLIPRTNPFLRAFFEQITGSAMDDEPFAGFVDDLIQTLEHADMFRILEDFGQRGPRRDPVVHFYETFLQAYDPQLREVRGVYDTPEPVVNYIVQSIDWLLKNRFGLKAGLADHSRLAVKRSEGGREWVEQTHRVLILDPATGTATFLYKVLASIRAQFQKKQNAGQWGSYVHEHLLPRLFGFELLMAPYAVAHLKLGLALAALDEEPLFRQQWSYEPRANERLNIFLTNTLEDLERTTELLGPLRALSDEANSAREIKRHKPVLIVLGNPPYSGHSANKGEWISKLVRDYYFCDGKPLGERNPKWLQDDYVKFIRWGQWRIEQTGQGVLAFITNHGYLDNPTFRGMRQHLMQTFDEIYVLDLHGNSKKKETVPGTGEADKNVFDIQQGVAIGIFVKLPPTPHARKKPATFATIHHSDLWGAQRKTKYDWLDSHHTGSTKWTTLTPASPQYLFIPQHTKRLKEYERGWKVTEMMPVTVIGPNSHRDAFAIAFAYDEALSRLKDLANPDISPEELVRRYALKESSDWTVRRARSHDLRQVLPLRCVYRPFDERYMLWGAFAFDRPRQELISHLLRENIGLISTRQTKELFSVFSTVWPVGQHKLATPYDGSYVSPLYLYPNGKLPEADLFAHEDGRRPNLSADFIRELCVKLQVKFVADGLGRPGKREVGPELIFFYTYAVFHSPIYRERYAEFLRADFPRLPLTADFKLFRALAGFGSELVALHARGKGEPRNISYPVRNADVIEEVRYQPPQGQEPGRVRINDRQYFEGVPESAWTFPFGGYLPAQRWLRDRIGRRLSYEEQAEYQRIIWALLETKRLMGEIDACIEQHGGWPLK